MRFYVDDLRRCPDGWKLARTITDAISLLFKGFVHEISIDHDIVFLSMKIGKEIKLEDLGPGQGKKILMITPPNDESL